MGKNTKSGIFNVSGSCYANVIIQSIHSMNSLKNFFLDCNHQDEQIISLKKVLCRLDKKEFSIVPTNLSHLFLKYLSDKNVDVVGGQDPLEFLKFLLLPFYKNNVEKMEDFLFCFECQCNSRMIEFFNLITFDNSPNNIFENSPVSYCLKCQKNIFDFNLKNIPKAAIFCFKLKNNTSIFSSEEQLDYLVIKDKTYSVSSVVQHDSDHFNCFLRDGDKWHLYNDELISLNQIPPNNSNVYMTFLKSIADKVRKKNI